MGKMDKIFTWAISKTIPKIKEILGTVEIISEMHKKWFWSGRRYSTGT